MRLIDADALLKVINGYCDDREGLKEYIEESILQSHELYDKDAKMPTVDAVPVVRCEDCKHKRINSFAKESGIIYCALHNMGVLPDDFCSYGERPEPMEGEK